MSWKNISKGNYDVSGTNLKSNLRNIVDNYQPTSINLVDTGIEGTIAVADSLLAYNPNVKTINIFCIIKIKIRCTC